ncbi:MFS transporter [Saccharopolyspora elongata]|uniref:MFS transporter n=1 Tax=Saccharopolyspora elongata TaxID=2530387 RepID=A0A4R4YRU0_9PSEU|nr:MFS transporter [Saccharopolyspora elongata]TDD47903.1 MFS transporter [Saccharopolyspora elongata]
MTATAPPRVAARPPLVLTALLVAVASFQMNATMLSPAIDNMATSLNTDVGTIGLTATVFLFVAGLAGVVLPRYSDIIGRRRALFGSIAVMAAGSLIATIAPNVEVLMAGRALQGACGATISLGILTLRDILPTKQFGRYLGILTAVNSGVAGVDTLLGGVITDTIGFRGIFGFTFALEVIAVVMIGAWVPDSERTGTRMDWKGAAVICLALLGLNAWLSLGPTVGWFAPWPLACLAAGLALLVVFWLVERGQSDPLLPLPALRSRGVWGLLVTTFCTMASIFAVLTFVYPTLAQNAAAGFGYDGTTTALMFLMPYALAGWILAPLAGTLAPKIGYRKMLRIGLVGNLALIAATVFAVKSPWLLFALVALMGVSYAACAATALNGMGVIYAPKESPGILPGLNATMFNLGASVGIGVLSGLAAQGTPEGATNPAGFTTALVVATAISAAALLASFVLPGKQSSTEKV